MAKLKVPQSLSDPRQLLAWRGSVSREAWSFGAGLNNLSLSARSVCSESSAYLTATPSRCLFIQSGL